MRKRLPQPPQTDTLPRPVIPEDLPVPAPVQQLPPSPTIRDFIATVVLESSNDNQFETHDRFDVLKSVVSDLMANYLRNGVIIFPAGMFCTGENAPSSLYPLIEKSLSQLLAATGNNIIVCFGIDGSVDGEGYARDQVAVAADRTGIIALGKKFYPANAEKGHVNLAGGFNIPEDGKSRIFRFGNHSFYLGMCYDGFGIKNHNIKNPGVTGFIELAHCFYPKGQGPSGESYFARHGFAGTARQWGCPVYGTAVFFSRRVPERWPTGVVWDQGTKSTTEWNYSMNPLRPFNVVRMDVPGGAAEVRMFIILDSDGKKL